MNLYMSSLYRGIYNIYNRFIKTPYKLRSSFKGADIKLPLILDTRFVKLEKFTRLHPDVKIISAGAPVVIKKYSAIAYGCIIIPGTHVPTVGIPQFLSTLHINDKESGIIINEDCWVGAESALLSGCEIGRGSVVGARCVVTKKFPPYAVLAGVPAKIIATRFSLEEVIQHEKLLYPESERLDLDYLKKLYENDYKGLRSIGTDNISTEDLIRMNEAKRTLGIKVFE